MMSAKRPYGTRPFGELKQLQARLEEDLVEARGAALHRTRQRAHERISESLGSKLDDAIRAERSRLRDVIARRTEAVPPAELTSLAALLALKGDSKIAETLREDVDRRPWHGESDDWLDDAVARRREIEKQLAAVTDEVEFRIAHVEVEKLDEKRKGILARIGAKT